MAFLLSSASPTPRFRDPEKKEEGEMKPPGPYALPFFLALFIIHMISIPTPSLASHRAGVGPNEATGAGEQLHGITPESLQFLFAQNLVRQSKSEPPLSWDYDLERYAQWWAGQRRHDCELVHSFPEGEFRLGENIYWGGGSAWTPDDAVRLWAGEEKYYDYASNSCEEGQMCGHYTQIVWRDTRKVGCARVVCDDGDVFMTCNYYPPGNYDGERPY